MLQDGGFMLSGFIINAVLFFDAKNFHLLHIDKGEIANLSGVKGRCLLCLLNNKTGEATSKKELFSEVWEKYGLYANDNSLLQTIYSLRKELNEVGLKDFVITKPRLGYQINHAYHIHEANNINEFHHDNEYKSEVPLTPIDEKYSDQSIDKKHKFYIHLLTPEHYSARRLFKIILSCIIFTLMATMLIKKSTRDTILHTPLLPYLIKLDLDCRCQKAKHLDKNEIVRRCICQPPQAQQEEK
jgi:DNA-binding winged helix-turn-helix (wHTH) protein